MAFTSTLAVAGFPLDATPRELKNICKGFPGFLGCRVNAKGGKASNVFVKFDSPQSAAQAVERLNELVFDENAAPGVTLKADFARRELELWEIPGAQAPGAQGAPQWQATQHDLGSTRSQSYPEQAGMQPQKRPRIWQPPTNLTWQPPQKWQPAQTWQPAQKWQPPAIQPYAEEAGPDTIACKIDGREEGHLRDFFAQLPGFIDLKFNTKVNGCFVKFADTNMAQVGLQAAHENELNAQFAKRSLEMSSDAPANYISGVDTLACKIGGRTKEEFEELMVGVDGFVALTFNDKVGGCFVKFTNPAIAAAALETVQGFGIVGDFAKRNLQA